jgi:hypothetical protein
VGYRWIVTAARSGIQVVGSQAPPPPPPPGPITITSVQTWVGANGNSAHIAWSDDSTYVVQANEESNSGFGNELLINAASASAPAVQAMAKFMQYDWPVAQSGGVVAYVGPLNGWVTGTSIPAFAKRWQVWPYVGGNAVGAGDLATDGTYVYVPNASNQGGLLVLNATDGSQAAAVYTPDAWGPSYTVRLTSFGGHRYCLVTAGSSSSTTPAAPGGVYAFDITTPTAPSYAGKVFTPSYTDWAVVGSKLYLLLNTSAPGGNRDTIQVWDISTLTAPVQVGSAYVAPAMNDPTLFNTGGAYEYVNFQRVEVNAAGTRLYATYTSRSNTGIQTPNAPAGWVILSLDANGENPTPLPSQVSGSGTTPPNQLRGQWIVTNAGLWAQPNTTGDIRLSPDGTKVAVSYWTLGVAFWALSGDTVAQAPSGFVPTTGEVKDNLPAANGAMYLPAGDDLQVVSSADLIVNAVLDYASGGFRPFANGLWVEPASLYGSQTVVIDPSKGTTGFIVTTLNTVSHANDARYDPGSNTLYTASPSGLRWFTVGAAPSYSLTEQPGSPFSVGMELTGLSLPFTGPDGNTYIAALSIPGTTAFVIRLTGTGAPAIVMQDGQAFSRQTSYGNSGTNGPFATVEVVRNHLYFACHRSGVQIYPIGSYSAPVATWPYQATWIDLVNQDLVVINSYNGSYSTTPPDGLYIADLRVDPVAPTFYAGATTPLDGSSGWRSRYIAPYVYKTGLGWTTQYQLQGYP